MESFVEGGAFEEDSDALGVRTVSVYVESRVEAAEEEILGELGACLTSLGKSCGRRCWKLDKEGVGDVVGVNEAASSKASRIARASSDAIRSLLSGSIIAGSSFPSSLNRELAVFPEAGGAGEELGECIGGFVSIDSLRALARSSSS